MPFDTVINQISTLGVLAVNVAALLIGAHLLQRRLRAGARTPVRAPAAGSRR